MASALPAEAIVKHLNKVIGPDKDGWYTALCVFHNDQNRPNLRINESGFHCFTCGAKGSLSALAQKLGIAGTAQSMADRIVAEYNYRDERNLLLFQVVRLLPKDFRQRRQDSSGGWIWNLKGLTTVPYRLPELLAADPKQTVFIVEGEKDVERLAGLGLTATCNPGGAGKWRPHFSQHLRGRHVVTLPDNDDAGRMHMRDVAGALAGIAAEVRSVALPGLPAKGDVSDWLDSGGTAEELVRLAGAAAIVETHSSGPRLVSARDLVLMDLPEPRWAVPNLVPEGLMLFAGKPKIGKSWVALNLGLAVAAGGYALGSFPTEQGDALYLALEDTDRRIKARLQDILGDGAGPTTLTFSREWPRLDEGGDEDLRIWLRTHPAARLVIIDTLAKIRPKRRTGENLYDSDYEAMSILKRIAEEFAVAIVVVHHQRKMQSSDPFDTVSGTLGLTGAADSTAILVRDKLKKVTTFYLTGRDVDETEFNLVWDDRLCCWIRVHNEEERREVSAARQQLVDVLTAEGRRMQPGELAKAAGKGGGSVRKLLRDMLRDGQVGSEGGFYYLPSLGNSGNEGNSSNNGNSGNNDGRAVTEVMGAGNRQVTPDLPETNLEEAQSHRVTGVTEVGENPARKPVCDSCGRSLSIYNSRGRCGICALNRPA